MANARFPDVDDLTIVPFLSQSPDRSAVAETQRSRGSPGETSGCVRGESTADTSLFRISSPDVQGSRVDNPDRGFSGGTTGSISDSYTQPRRIQPFATGVLRIHYGN